MRAARRQLLFGVALGLAATAAWFGFHSIYLSLLLFVLSIGFVTHAPCIQPSGEHGETCAGLAGESHPQSARERPLTSYVASVFICVAIALASELAWDLIKNYSPSVAEAVTSQRFRQAMIWAAASAMGLLWIRRVVTAARMLKARALSQLS